MRNFFHRSASGRKACGGHRTYLQVERLDDRTVPSTFTVTNLNDSGPDSLRAAIEKANADPIPDQDTIDATGVSGKITLLSALPALSDRGGLILKGPGASSLTVARSDAPEAPLFRIFTVGESGTVALSGLTITKGSTYGNLTSSGSGIANSGTLTLNNVVISGNFPPGSGVAGGIYNSGTLTLNYSTVSGNNGGGSGGGIWNDGTLTLNYSTVSGNRAGGWNVGGGIGNTGVLTLNNSTVSGNTAYEWSDGGGIWNADTGTLTLNNSTVSDNSASGAVMVGVGGGIFNAGRATLNNTIVANSPSGGDVFNTGTLTGSYNLIEDGSPAPQLDHTLTGDPLLGPLQDNGGPTFTHALLLGSPAIDAGVAVPGVTTDQRGVPRPQGSAPDIGAYEYQITNTPDTQAPTAPGTLTATVAGTSQINLSWPASTDNVGVTGYRVERQGPGGSSFAEVATVTGTTYSDTGLTAGSKYSYRVRATDAAGNLSGYSPVATATTQAPDTQAPTAPGTLTATVAGTSQINLSWPASTDNVGVTGYQVERQGPKGSSFTQVATVTGTTYSDTGLKAGSKYSYRVRATDAAGNLSGYSNVASATTNRSRQNYTATSIGNAELHVRNTIITGNGYDLSGDLGSWGHNLIGNPTIGSGFAATDLLNVDPKLYPLQDNGGPTYTHALMSGSPAIDAGDNTGAPATVQRGQGHGGQRHDHAHDLVLHHHPVARNDVT